MSAAHAKPVPRRDHLWVLAVIAFCCLIKVWPSWVGIGAEAGFPKLGKMATDWTLAIVIEAYWAYAVWAALVPAGRRSRLFAAWSAAGVFVLSLVGQSTASVMTVTAVKVFANALPVVVLALIAVLVHLRRVDRAEAEAAEQAHAEAERDAQQASAKAAQITGLEAAVSALTRDLEATVSARAEAETALTVALTRAEKLEAKLAAKTAQAKRSRAAQGTGRKGAQDEDLTTEMRALTLFEKKPELRKPGMGSELGRQLGLSAQTGRRLHARLAAQYRSGEHPGASSDEHPGERSEAS